MTTRKARHKLTVETEVNEEKGKLSYQFDATGFEPDCDPYATPNFKPMDDAKKQAAEKREEMDKGVIGEQGKRQVEDDESPIKPSKKSTSDNGKSKNDDVTPPPQSY